MKPDVSSSRIPISQLVLVRPEPPGQYTAQVVGLPELRATAATREEAIEMVRATLEKELTAGHLVPIHVPQEKSLQEWFGRIGPNDPLEQEFLEELERFRKEDLERTLQEYELEDRACSDSSTTPTT